MGGVIAASPTGTYPSCITNLSYEDYSLFAETKSIIISWTVTNAADAAESYLVYYVADEDEPSWYQQRVYWYTRNYNYVDEYRGDATRRIVHLDQGPTAKAGNTYSAFYDDDSSLNLSSEQSGIGWVPSMNPFLVGRAVKWDDPTCWNGDPSDPVIKKIRLSEGHLEIPNVSKSKIVFFNFLDKDGNYYAGPDKLTNSQAAANRHSPMSVLPWNECYISAHLKVQMPLKILWSSNKEGPYNTEVSAGTDVVFDGTAWVKFQWNTDFISDVQKVYDSNFLSDISSEEVTGTESYKIYYTTTSLLPYRGERPYDMDQKEPGDTYETDRLAALQYNGTPIKLTSTSVLRFAIFADDDDTRMYLGQDDRQGSINNVLSGCYLNNSGNQTLAYYDQSKFQSICNDNYPVGLVSEGSLTGSIPPIQTFLRNNHLWGITFMEQETAGNPIAKTFSRPIPYTSWSETIGGRYGLGTGTYSYETWVSDGDYLVPSSLEGICDFYIVSQNAWLGEDDITSNSNTEIYLSRINWIPKDMPVIVRYRNYSRANSLPATVATAIDKATAAAEAELENGMYFQGSSSSSTTIYSDLKGAHEYYRSRNMLETVLQGDLNANNGTDLEDYLQNESEDYSDLSTWVYDENGDHYNVKLKERKTDAGGHPLYIYYGYSPDGYQGIKYNLYKKTTDGEGHETLTPLYFVWDEDNDAACSQKQDNGNLVYHSVNAAGQKLYQETDENGTPLYYFYYGATPLYFALDNSGNILYQEVNESGSRLYDKYDESGNRLYQEVDADGNKLYVLCGQVGISTYAPYYFVYYTPSGSEQRQKAGPFPYSTAVNNIKPQMESLGYKDVEVTLAKVTENEYQGIDRQPAETTEVTAYPLTQIIPNEHPCLTTDNTDYPAYTTAETGQRVTSTLKGDDPVITTTATAIPVETTDTDNSALSEEAGYVPTTCDPIVDGYGYEPYIYTTTANGHPAYVWNGSKYNTTTPYEDSYQRDWITTRPELTTEDSHYDENYGETCTHVPVYDPAGGAADAVAHTWRMGGNYFTNIRTLSNDMFGRATAVNSDFTAEPHTFYLYPGDPEHCQYNPQWNMYHLSTRLHRDEANFLNVLRYSETPIAVDEYDNYYGFSFDHKNEFHPAFSTSWAFDCQGGNDYVFANDNYAGNYMNVSLQAFSFMQRYTRLCAPNDNSSQVHPVVDNWLVYAPSYNSGETDWDNIHGSTTVIAPYYYGYGPADYLRKQTAAATDDDYSNYSNSQDSQAFGGWTSAAWKHVVSGTIAARRPYLQLFGSPEGGHSFLNEDDMPKRDPSDVIDYTNQPTPAKFNFGAGGGLLLYDAVGNDGGDVTVVKLSDAARTGTDTGVYDLQGRRVGDSLPALSGRLAKGVYIFRGRKYVVK